MKQISELLSTTVSEKDKLKYYKQLILDEIQKTNPKCTKLKVHWRIIKGIHPCKADDIEQLYYKTKSKAQYDRISFDFAFNILTKIK